MDTLCDFGSGDSFLDMTPKPKATIVKNRYIVFHEN